MSAKNQGGKVAKASDDIDRQINRAETNYEDWLNEFVKNAEAYKASHPGCARSYDTDPRCELAHRQSDLWQAELYRLRCVKRGASTVLIPFLDAHQDHAFQRFVRALVSVEAGPASKGSSNSHGLEGSSVIDHSTANPSEIPESIRDLAMALFGELAYLRDYLAMASERVDNYTKDGKLVSLLDAAMPRMTEALRLSEAIELATCHGGAA